MFNVLAGMGDIEKTGKAIVDGFSEMISLLKEIRDTQKAILETLKNQEPDNAG